MVSYLRTYSSLETRSKQGSWPKPRQEELKMSRLVPAIRGRMGNMDYYILTFKASSLANYVRTPRNLPGWDDLNLEERYQREINLNRVKNQLALYWATNESHFFGSIIVAPANVADGNFNEERIANNFEAINNMAAENLPSLYKEAAQDIGFLTLPDEIILVPLDGQHRVKAIQFAIDGKDADGKIIGGFDAKPELGAEDISVILVNVDTTKARSIFTHVNRYAKPTSAGQNYITSDDDILAVVAREIANRMSARLVKYATNTLTPKDEHFTTLSTIYNCIFAIAESHYSTRLDTTRLPDQDVRDYLHSKAEKVWDVLLSRIDIFREATENSGEDGDDKRKEIRGKSLLGRPVTQECLFRAFLRLTKEPTNLSNDEAADKLNKLPWDLTRENVEKVWQNVLWSGDEKTGRMITKNRKLTSDLIFYLADGRMDDKEKQELLKKYQEQFTETQRPEKLPSL